MARALIVGCGCHGRELGAALAADGWAVRGTTRDEARLASIEAAGIEAVVADPDRVGSVLDHVGDVAVVVWLMGSADGDEDAIEAVNVLRLGSLLEKLVDTPVRGFVFEGAGSVNDEVLARGRAEVERAAATWAIPVRSVSVGRNDVGWLEAARGAVGEVLRG